MKRGQKPKPTALKKLHGNPGHRTLNKNEPKPTGTTGPPAWLDPVAKAEWRRMRSRLERLDLLTPADRATFAAYCSAYSALARAEKFLNSPAAGGSFHYETAGGALKPWPEVAIANAARDQVRKLAAEFGMTPAERSRVGRPAGDDRRSELRAFLYGDDRESELDAAFLFGSDPSSPFMTS